MTEYFTLFMGAVIVNNFILTRFLGLCIFFGVSKSLSASTGMGMAVAAILTVSSALAWLVYNYVLIPYDLMFLKIVVTVLLMAGCVQFLEIAIKRFAPALYEMWGIYLLLIATNCVILGVPLINATENYGFIKSIVNAFGSGVGFALALVLMASLREKLQYADVPKSLQGLGIAFVVAGMLALSFLGFSGMIPL